MGFASCFINVSKLTLSPTAEKCRPHHSIGLRRLQATMIVVSIYARRRVLSLVPAYEVCVCKWGARLVDIPPS